jgi:hypothetical protein
MSQTTILTRVEIETMGPPLPEELADTGISEGFLCDLALKHVAMLPEPSTWAIAEQMRLPRTLTEEILHKLFREKLIQVKVQAAVGSIVMRCWTTVGTLESVAVICGYTGPAPVSLRDTRTR